MFKSVLVVCTGNICRSPLAEALLCRDLADRDIKVESAGTSAMVGVGAEPPAQEVALERGLDITTHRARQLTREMLAFNDLVLVLDQHHERWITQRFPEFRGKTFRLGRWSDNRNIADPYRLPKSAFIQTMNDVTVDVRAWLSGCRPSGGWRVLPGMQKRQVDLI